jgi:anti-anti-sigma regulatory factor
MRIQLGRLEAEIAGGHVTLSGRIDDSAILAQLVPHVTPGQLVIDTSRVTFINSIGMREWLRLVRAVRERGGTIVLERVADVLMTQMNLIAELASSMTIASFHAQYVCSACGAESAPLVDAVANADGLRRLEAPKLPCRDCGGTMELGDFPERYLSIFRS